MVLEIKYVRKTKDVTKLTKDVMKLKIVHEEKEKTANIMDVEKTVNIKHKEKKTNLKDKEKIQKDKKVIGAPDHRPLSLIHHHHHPGQHQT